jgi:DNA-binding NarL/FixJ family response regulator
METPVLIVSAHQESEELGETNGLSVSGYVSKPIDFDDLLGRVAELTS